MTFHANCLLLLNSLHEISDFMFFSGENKKTIINLLSAEFAQSVLKVKDTVRPV